MDDTTQTAPEAPRRGWVRGAALAVAGLVAGGALVGTLTATAADEGSGADDGTASTAPGDRPEMDPSQPMRPDEELLTGSTKEKVQAAALAEYPGATIERIESDSDGVYEAHLVTADGERVTVEVGEDFTVTGTEQVGRGGGPGMGDHEQDEDSATQSG